MTGKSEEEKSAELRKKIEYQVACEERAHRIVETLIENPITEDMLINCLHFITTSHYDDITVERAVSKLCGYPLCQNSLGNILKQKYMISTKTNKVYDIESRKNFCSAKCYKASKQLERQISNDPLWTRKNLPPRKYEFLPLDMETGQIGDEVKVTQHIEEMKREVATLEKQDQYFQNLNEILKKSESSHKPLAKGRDGNEKFQGRNACEDEQGESSGEMDKYTTEDVSVYTLEKALKEVGIKDGVEKASGNADGDKADVSESKTPTYVNRDDCDAKAEHVRGNLQESHGELSVEGKKMMSLDVVASTEPMLSVGEKSVKGHTDKEPDTQALKKTKCHTKPKSANKSKTDYLMQLLDKRKSLLSKMADIQDHDGEGNSVKDGKKDATFESIRVIERPVSWNSERTEQLCHESQGARSTRDVYAKCDPIQVIETPVTLNSVTVGQLGDVTTSERDAAKAASGEDAKGSVAESKSNVRSTDLKRETSVPVSAKEKHVPKNLPTLQLICQCIKSWMTQETRTFLGWDKAEKRPITGSGDMKPEFENEYKALVAKVDAQENDFDRLLGEESLEDSARPSAPLPHFEILKEEMLEHQQRVQHFFKGSFTYRVQEKPMVKEDHTQSIVLPTVDRYDQMLIRQKIVLDRLSKVLPDVLAPLHMLVQDVFTDLRQLVFTFNLTNENILFKPVEWIIAAVLLLKVLSTKIHSLKQAFSNRGAWQYYDILLSPLGENLSSIEKYMDGFIE